MHCPTLVLVPATDRAAVEPLLYHVLAPFRDTEVDGDDVARFDRYVIGGRFATLFGGEDHWRVGGLPPNVADGLCHLVEPTGDWHDATPLLCWPRAGWAATERKPRDLWRAEVTEVLSAYSGDYAVLVDLHH